MIISFVCIRIKKIIYNGFMHSLALKQRLGAVTEDILTPSSHGRSLKILLWGGIEVFKSISLLIGGDSTSLCTDPTPLRKSHRRGTLLKFFLRGRGAVCTRARTGLTPE